MDSTKIVIDEKDAMAAPAISLAAGAHTEYLLGCSIVPAAATAIIGGAGSVAVYTICNVPVCSLG